MSAKIRAISVEASSAEAGLHGDISKPLSWDIPIKASQGIVTECAAHEMSPRIIVAKSTVPKKWDR